MQEVTVLAVDGGGTGCRAALCDEAGRILAYAQGDCCNYHSIGSEKTAANLTSLFIDLAKNQPLSIKIAVLGFAGLDTKKDKDILTPLVQQALSAANITAADICLYNDAILTVKGRVGQNNGVLIAAGTGSIACGVTKEGLETRVGGWGYRVGDEGSGYSIGKAAIIHTLRSYDGREAVSGISAATLRELAVTDEAELLDWVYGPRFSVPEVAALTPVIVQLAEQGDRQAETIIQQACQQLETMACTVIKKLGLPNAKFSLVLSGGVLKNPLISRQLTNRLAAMYPNLEVLDHDHPPVCSGLRQGLISMGIDNEVLLDTLSSQLRNFAEL